jgi:hypothetical protein
LSVLILLNRSVLPDFNQVFLKTTDSLIFLSRRFFSCCALTQSYLWLRRLLRQSVPKSSPLLPQMALLFPPTALPQTPIPLRSPISAAACRRPRLHHHRRKRLLLSFSSSCAFFINVLAGGDVGRHRWKEG